MSELHVLGGVSLICPVLLALGFVTMRNSTRSLVKRAPRERASHHLIIALAASLGAAIVVGEGLQIIRGGWSFSVSGQQRYITAPIVYGGFALVVLLSLSQLRGRWPAWAVGLPVICVMGTLFGVFSTGASSLATLLQGIVLIGGAALFAAAGLLDVEWSELARRRLLFTLIGAGAGAGALGFTTGIFSALQIPSAAICIYLLRNRRWWSVLTAIVGILLLLRTLAQSADATDPSSALTGQVLVSAILLTLAALPVAVRLPLVVAGVVVGALALAHSGIPGLFFGTGTDLADVTLAQRAYEAQQVAHQVSTNLLSLIFGGGPGATINLSGSPDTTTLASSGRNLLAVPSVHLLTSHVLMKSGFLGLVWLAAFFCAAGLAAVDLLRHKRPPLFDLVLLVFVFAGIIQAVPAGSFLFSNPLPMLLLAVLHVRRRQRKNEMSKVSMMVKVA